MNHRSGTITIKAGTNVGDLCIDKRDLAAIYVLIPAGFQGILAVRGSNKCEYTGLPLRDEQKKRVQVDPSTYTLPEWQLLSTSLFPVHFIQFESFTAVDEAAPQNQAVDRVLEWMGIAQ